MYFSLFSFFSLFPVRNVIDLLPEEEVTGFVNSWFQSPARALAVSDLGLGSNCSFVQARHLEK